MNTILVTDCETTCLSPSRGNLLTAAFSVLDSDKLEAVATLDLAITSEIYHVSPAALKCNKIDLVQHDEREDAVSSTVASERFQEFLQPYQMHADDRIILCGHVVSFDAAWLQHHLYAPLVWARTSHRFLDTASIALFLQLIGKLPDGLGTSLEKLCAHFGIQYEAHNARQDCDATIQLLQHLCFVARQPNSPAPWSLDMGLNDPVVEGRQLIQGCGDVY